MNPTDQPPSAEAVKAAFAFCGDDPKDPNTWEASDDADKFLWSMPQRPAGENPLRTAARILAAHARAREAAINALIEKWERESDFLCNRGSVVPAHKWDRAAGEAYKDCAEDARKALTGEASA